MPHGKIVFNRKIALDLMVINGNYLLHVVDTDAGFGAAQYLHGQSTEDVWATFIECWAAVYSRMPDIMATDQGSCFTAERWKELAGENGIVMQLSGVQAHNALGIGERYHAPLRRIVNKIDCSTPGMAKETVLKLAVKTMNDTMGPSGLVPSYLVFGSLPRFPARTKKPDLQHCKQLALKWKVSWRD
jgi:transposase InsO family protein